MPRSRKRFPSHVPTDMHYAVGLIMQKFGHEHVTIMGTFRTPTPSAKQAQQERRRQWQRDAYMRDLEERGDDE